MYEPLRLGSLQVELDTFSQSPVFVPEVSGTRPPSFRPVRERDLGISNDAGELEMENET